MALDPVTAALDLGTRLVEHFFPNKTEQDAAKLKLAVLLQDGTLKQLAIDSGLAQAQAEINKVEAASPLTFISGWRPFVGWVCGVGLAVQYVIGPLIAWGSALARHPVALPPMDMAALMPLLLGMLGLGTMRTIEKIKDVASK